MTITISCRQCGHKHTVAAEHAGKQIRCKQCASSVLVPMPRGIEPRGGSAVRPPAGAPLTPARVEQVTCPHCRGVSAIRPEWRGIQLECPTCKQQFQVPGVAGAAPSRFRPNAASWQTAPVARDDAASDERIEHDSPNASRRKSEFHLSRRQLQFMGGGAVAFVLVGFVIYFAVKLRSFLGPAGPQQPFPMDMVAMPEFQVPAQGRTMEPGVHRYEIRLNGTLGTAGHFGKMWLYLPEGRSEMGSLPCVLIAPAGAMVFTGMNLADEDAAEHVPYVRVGFAVLSYEIDGACPNAENASDEQIARSINAFRAADAGLANARIATEYALKRVPQVDPKQLFAVGHSSAAQHALLFAEHEMRLKGCVAFAPVVDTVRCAGPAALAVLSVRSPGLLDFAARSSPKCHEQLLGCPVLLFHARNDSNVPVSESQQCAARLKRLGKDVTLVTVATGDHYNSMIDEGIPAAIKWMMSHGAEPKPPIVGAVAAAPPPATKNTPLSEEVERRREESQRRADEAAKKSAEIKAKIDADIEKRNRGVIDEGPGWELVLSRNSGNTILTHHEIGFRLQVPTFWEMSRAAENVTTVVPSADRQIAIALAPRNSLSGGLGAFVRVETFSPADDSSPPDMLKNWERSLDPAEKKKSNYQRVGSFESYKLGALPAGRLVYSVRDMQTNGQFEIDVVRREDTVFVVTAALVNDSFGRSQHQDDVKKVLLSFELIPPRKAGENPSATAKPGDAN